jgi:hypothetical protein
VERASERLTHEPAGGLVVGPRYSGKSYLADRVAVQLRMAGSRVRHFSLRDWLTHSTTYTTDVGRLADAHVTACLKTDATEPRPSVWVVDDAHVLLAAVSGSVVDRLADEVRAGRVRVILVRNRYAREDGGWFADREAAVLAALNLPRFELLPSAGPVPPTLADGLTDDAAAWLELWAGGWTGLMHRLRPYATAGSLRPDNPTDDLLDEVRHAADEFALRHPVTAALVRAAAGGWLPPPRCLAEGYRSEAGLLAAIGLVQASWRPGRPGGECQGEFWERVAEAAVGPSPPALEDRYDRLVAALASADYMQEMADGLGLDADPAVLAAAFASVRACERLAPGVVTPLDQCLADHLGRIGLARVLRSLGRSPDLDRRAVLLAREVLDAAH